MSHNNSAPLKTWTRPEAQRLGRIRDVAGQNGGSVNNGVNTNRS